MSERLPLTSLHAELRQSSVGGALARVYSVGSLYGIPVKLHASLIFLMAFAVVSTLLRGGTLLLNVLFYGPVLLGSVFIHEISHALVALAVGGSVDEILVWPLGGFCKLAHSHTNPRCFLFHDILIAAAGPLSHIPQALAWRALSCESVNKALQLHWHSAILRGRYCAGFWDLLCSDGYRLNISLCLFNLLVPVHPLDGGRVFASILQLCLSKKRSAWIIVGTSVSLGLGLSGWGVLLWLAHDQLAWLTLFVGIFMIVTGHDLLDLIKDNRLSEHPLFRA